MARKSKKWNGILGNDKVFVAKIEEVDTYFDELFKHYTPKDVELSSDIKYKFLIFEMAKELKIPAFLSIAKQEEYKKKEIEDFIFYRDVITKAKSSSILRAIEEYANENNLGVEYATLERRFRRVKAKNRIVEIFHNREIFDTATKGKLPPEMLNEWGDLNIVRSAEKLPFERLLEGNTLFQADLNALIENLKKKLIALGH